MRKSVYELWFLSFFMATSYACYIWLRVQHILKISEPRIFYDTSEYFEVGSHSLTSSLFWIAKRPPLVPLFFKLLGMDPARIVTVQLWISILAWGILALVLVLVMHTFWLKPLTFMLILLFSLVQNVIMWDALILGDSLALSLLALFLASSLWLLAEWQTYRFILLVISSILLALVRDTYAYFLLMAGAGLLTFIFFTRQRRRVLMVSGLFFSLFLAVNMLAAMGMRWYLPLLMTVGLRILPNPEYVAYFEAHGMPVSDLVMERAGKPIQADNVALLYDPVLEKFRLWVKENGRSEFIKFLWFFKADSLQNPIREVDLVFNPDVYYYAATGFRPILRDVRLNELLYPTRFGILASFLANIIAAIMLYPAFRYRNHLWTVPLMLILLSYPQAVLIWNADANDIARHSVYHVIMLRLGFWLLILFGLDFFFAQVKIYMNRKIYYA